jgi:hypothetical protein
MEEGKEIDPYKDELKGILSLHKFVIDRLHTDYAMFTEWVEEAQNGEAQGTSGEDPYNTAWLPLLTPPSTKRQEVERGQREAETTRHITAPNQEPRLQETKGWRGSRRNLLLRLLALSTLMSELQQ